MRQVALRSSSLASAHRRAFDGYIRDAARARAGHAAETTQSQRSRCARQIALRMTETTQYQRQT